MSACNECSATSPFDLSPADRVTIRADLDSLRRQRSHVELLLAFLDAKRPGGALAPFDDADRAVAARLVERLRESVAPVFARPWQPALPPRPIAQLVASDLIATLPDARVVAPSDAWIDRLRAVRDGLLALN